jgi:hypothetical protein
MRLASLAILDEPIAAPRAHRDAAPAMRARRRRCSRLLHRRRSQQAIAA